MGNNDVKENAAGLTFARKLLAVHVALKVPKSRFNKFGKYSYRNAEDILEAVKPLAEVHNILLTITDEIVIAANRIYIQSTAKVTNVDSPSETIECSLLAIEAESKSGRIFYRLVLKSSFRSLCGYSDVDEVEI